MAATNHERVGRAMELLRAGLAPFVEREVIERVKARAVRMDTIRRFAEDPALADRPMADWDASGLLRLMWETWNDVFRHTLGFTERSLVSELRTWRNKWAHQERFSSDDADRALDSAERLLTAVSAPQAGEVAKIKMELRRLVFDEQVRGERRRAAGALVEAAATSGGGGGALAPWRVVATPHQDVASGRYQQAEFAADLWQVHLGEGADEYRDPHEFFRRTFLTESLKGLLATAVRRLAGRGGDPVVQLQTNFGGGKTHSMLALYHLFSGVAPRELPGADEVLAAAGAGAGGGTGAGIRAESRAARVEAGSRTGAGTGAETGAGTGAGVGAGSRTNTGNEVETGAGVGAEARTGTGAGAESGTGTAASTGTIAAVRRVVLVGNKISPGNPVTKPDGTVVRTLWGELAYQLGGPEAFEHVRADDERATNPGDTLRTLLERYGPCLVLIDEWVSYARQLHDGSDLPAGSFETQFTFAQALTEAVKVTKDCLLVISLPASDTTSGAGSPHGEADDAEVGGLRGREALDRLRNVVARVESPWRAASAEEGFEIVRRRLFEPLAGPEAFKQRDVTARAFADAYRAQRVEFPSECRSADYERRIRAAFPIHPEIFDRLYTDWSALARFQRTRGVLRLMAAVVHSLWESGDRNPLILPSTIPIEDPRVQNELTRYLPEHWTPVIEKDVDGPNSLPLRIDAEAPNLGKLSATRRVARTVYLGSAPTTAAAHRGIDDGRVKLGCVMPGETPALFGDALRRLAAAATYLYQDGARVWYATQPTVARLAEDRAEELRRNPDAAAKELEDRLKADLRDRGGFGRIHALPRSGADVPDDLDARLVVLSAEHLCSREPGNAAEAAARAILESRGSAPRLYRNTLVFLAADRVRYQDLDEALRQYLAWASVLEDKEELNLDPHQTRQAEVRWQAADDTVTARLPEAYQWLLAPEQETPGSALTWQAIRLTGTGVGAGVGARGGKVGVGVGAGARAGRTGTGAGAGAGRTGTGAGSGAGAGRTGTGAGSGAGTGRRGFGAGQEAGAGTGTGTLAERAGRRLRHDELLVTSLGGTILRRVHLDGVPLWRGEHVAVRQLVEDFARYLYLPRLAGPEVLARAIEGGLALLTWEAETFALAEDYDEAAGRYRGLQPGGRTIDVPPESAALLVRPDAARRQWDAEAPPPATASPGAGVGAGAGVDDPGGSGVGTDPGVGAGPGSGPGSESSPGTGSGVGAGSGTGMGPGMDPGQGAVAAGSGTEPAPPRKQPRRFHGAVTLDTTRVGRDASRIAEEVIAHLSGLVGAQVTVTLEIEAEVPDGTPDNVVRTVTENSRTLKFESHGFEES